MVYTDGTCMNNGKQNARCGSGIWFDNDSPRNLALRILGDTQSNQVGEIAAVIAAVAATAPYQPLKIVTNSKYVIEGLTANLKQWEDDGWINIKNTPLFKKAAHLLRLRTAKTTFQWIKGHNGTVGNEESNRLTKLGADKHDPDELDLEIPPEFDVQGAKLATLIQVMAYRGILERKKPKPRNSTRNNLRLTQDAIHQVTNQEETDEAIWCGTQKPVIRPIIQQFLYKTMHDAFIMGKRWRDVQGREDREICATCNMTDDMSHILTQCREQTTQLIWTLAKGLWPHRSPPWPEINLGTILGCGCITMMTDDEQRDEQRERKMAHQGPTQLLQSSYRKRHTSYGSYDVKE